MPQAEDHRGLGVRAGELTQEVRLTQASLLLVPRPHPSLNPRLKCTWRWKDPRASGNSDPSLVLFGGWLHILGLEFHIKQ